MVRAGILITILLLLSVGIIAFLFYEQSVTDGLRQAGDVAGAKREAARASAVASGVGVALILIGFFAGQAVTGGAGQGGAHLVGGLGIVAAAIAIYWSSRMYAQARVASPGPAPPTAADRETLQYTMDDAVWLRKLGLPQEAQARVDEALALSPLDDSAVKLLFNMEGAAKMRAAILQPREVFPPPEPLPTDRVRKSPRGRAIGPRGMIFVPAGEFTYQNGERCFLPEFFLDKFEVTNGQYAKFLDAVELNGDTPYRHPLQPQGKDHTPRYWPRVEGGGTGEGGDPLFYSDNLPVVGVDWFDAWAYAKWEGKRLPTEAEWERAARGPKGYLYPWGNEWDARRANTPERFAEFPQFQAATPEKTLMRWANWCLNPYGRRRLATVRATLPVDANRGDLSDFGARDMAGNVREWTADRYAICLDLAAPGPERKDRPELPPLEIAVTRGGSWLYGGPTHTNLYRTAARLTDRNCFVGFRCAK